MDSKFPGMFPTGNPEELGRLVGQPPDERQPGGLHRIRDMSAQELSEVFNKATTEAAYLALDAGHSIAGFEDGKVIYSHPDGTVSTDPHSGGPRGLS